MRVVVTGTSGAGKTTLARRIAAALAMPHIELDAINWQPGWRDLMRHDPEEFVRRVNTAIAAEIWVVDGNYGLVRDIVWERATHLVWLDYERWVIMARVIRRTIVRVTLRTELWRATANAGGICCGRAIRSAGPGIPGSGAAAKPRNDWAAKIMPSLWCCGCVTRARRDERSSCSRSIER